MVYDKEYYDKNREHILKIKTIQRMASKVKPVKFIELYSEPTPFRCVKVGHDLKDCRSWQICDSVKCHVKTHMSNQSKYVD